MTAQRDMGAVSGETTPPRPTRRRKAPAVHRDETGGIISNWLAQLLVIMAIVGLIGYEAVAVAVAAVSLEDEARQVAKVAADAYGSQQRIEDASAAADTAAEQLDVALLDVSPDGDHIRVTVRGQAGTLFLHRIGAFEDWTRPTATGRSNWRL